MDRCADVMLRKDHPVASLGCRGTFVEFGAKVFGRLVMAPRRFFLGSRMSRAWQASMVCSWRGWQFEMQGIAGRGPCGVAVRDGAGVASKRFVLGRLRFGMQGTQGVGFFVNVAGTARRLVVVRECREPQGVRAGGPRPAWLACFEEWFGCKAATPMGLP